MQVPDRSEFSLLSLISEKPVSFHCPQALSAPTSPCCRKSQHSLFKQDRLTAESGSSSLSFPDAKAERTDTRLSTATVVKCLNWQGEALNLDISSPGIFR